MSELENGEINVTTGEATEVSPEEIAKNTEEFLAELVIPENETPVEEAPEVEEATE